MTPQELFNKTLTCAFELKLESYNQAVVARQQCYRWRKQQTSTKWNDVVISLRDNVLTFRVRQLSGEITDLEPAPLQQVNDDPLANELGLDTSKTVGETQ